MAFKKVPAELLWEIVRSMQFHRRWAHVRVSHAFDHLLLKHMAHFLKHVQELAFECLSSYFDIRLALDMLRGEYAFGCELPKRVERAQWASLRLVYQFGIGELEIQDMPDSALPNRPYVDELLQKLDQLIDRFLQTETITIKHLCRVSRFLKLFAGENYLHNEPKSPFFYYVNCN
uniref:F-box domain-containing protein n=1 Tax=Globodera rostochiensis TaxID=31243 RepID=A0A914HKP3_GLORO